MSRGKKVGVAMDNKWHINKKGKVARCHAVNGNCPYKKHFHSVQKATDYLNKRNEEKYGLLSKSNDRVVLSSKLVTANKIKHKRLSYHAKVERYARRKKLQYIYGSREPPVLVFEVKMLEKGKTHVYHYAINNQGRVTIIGDHNVILTEIPAVVNQVKKYAEPAGYKIDHKTQEQWRQNHRIFNRTKKSKELPPLDDN